MGFFYVRLLSVPQIRIEAPAKLNLHLSIGGKRPDGFHEIDSLFLALSFGDTLLIENNPLFPDSVPEIIMEWQANNEIPLEKNIIYKAVTLFRIHAGYADGLKITVKKRIPPGGGLGGGSSDAAAVLLALNILASPGGGKIENGGLLEKSVLCEMGAVLGSDVPFFLSGLPAALVRGRGEIIQPSVLPETIRNSVFLLVNPGFSSDTAEAYRLLDNFRETGTAAKAADNSSWPYTNDFLPVFEACNNNGKIFRQIIDKLYTLGACFAGLSGSGSTCFGIFPNRDKIKTARETIAGQWPVIIETFPLAH